MPEVNVLILDDEQSILDLCVRLFRNETYGAAVTKDYREALHIIETSDVKVVLSDNRMPGISGVDFLRLVKEKKPEAVRILFTGYADVQVAEDAINKGEVYRLLGKPFELQELRSLVHESIERVDLLRQNRSLLESLQKRNAELEELSSKLKDMYESQQQLTYTVSHELRTPLALIKSSLDILDSDALGRLSDDQKCFVGRTRTGVERLGRLINDILDLAKFESGRMELDFVMISPREIVDDIIDMHTPLFRERGLVVIRKLPEDLPLVRADKDRLVQVFVNLLHNAMKFTLDGSVTIGAVLDKQEGVIFSVADTGIGIKPEDQPKLFEKFRQVGSPARQVGGTGLGLSICREIVRCHGGRIWLDSLPGEGSSFFFTIPLAKPGCC